MPLPATLPADDDALLRLLLSDRIDYERAEMPYSQRALNLARMRDLLARLGEPLRQMIVLHVAGTKGKGSTAAMLAAILTAAGQRTGLFSSPHVERLEERFAVDGQPCSREELVAALRRIEPALAEADREANRRGEKGPTYFELLTAIAAVHFAGRGARFAVLEVGLGGRFDSTNVCEPALAIITSISLDHTRQLGDTLVAIAGEKAGIIKPGVPTISGVTQPEPREVIRRVASERGSRLIELGRDFDYTYEPPRHLEREAALGRVAFRMAPLGGDAQLPSQLADVPLSLPGRHQAANAAIALMAVCELRRLSFSIPDEAVRRALATLRWPARVEVVARRPAIVIDGAHNVASIEALLMTLDESFNARRRHLVFGSSRDKDIAGMLARLLPAFDRVYLTRFSENPRATSPEELMQLASAQSPEASAKCELHASPQSALAAARAAATQPDNLICITGSLFLAGELRKEVVGSQ